MWILHKETTGLLWLELEYKDVSHFILPVFTSPDTAMDFVQEIEHEGERIEMQHIETTEELAEMLIMIQTQPASAVILDPPHPESITSENELSENELTYWTSVEFCDIAATLVMMSDTYDDKLIIDLLNRYLHNKLDQRSTAD
jgi:hypothetical protein